jgi:aquaporin Z
MAGAEFVRHRYMHEWTRPLIVEFIGTFTLIFIGAGAIMATAGTDIVAIALAHGLAIGLMVAAAGHISGGHYNPAVTVGFLVARRITPDKAAAYAAAQLLGALIAAVALKIVFDGDIGNSFELGTPAVGEGIVRGVGAAFLGEIILTFLLMFVIFGTAVDDRGPRVIAGFAIGLTITIDILALGPLTGAAMNPARWFGPAIVANFWDDAWVWIIAPPIGAALAAAVYNYVLIPETSPFRERVHPDHDDVDRT